YSTGLINLKTCLTSFPLPVEVRLTMAARKKGLSLEEKRAKMLELFYESKEFFQMKELEKIAPKKKGVISQSVKEVTQSLVDDGLVECEKIGTFVCYWAFPSKASQTVNFL
ncbi:hypothetical protein ANCCAN_26467, partial [Ancylostoma caninum]